MSRHHVRSFGTNKIVAIKFVRELSGCGLFEAKNHVEQQTDFTVTAGGPTQARISEEAQRFMIEFDPRLDGTTAVVPAADSEPGGAHCVRYREGSHKINAIKLVRELTGLGLKEALDIVDGGGLIRSALSLDQATAIEAKFEAIGAQVEVYVASEPSARVSGFDPDDEANDDF